MATFKFALQLLARRSKQILGQRDRYLSTTTVVFAHWNKDWKPGPIPRTPEERAEAAKKYGLRPEDYNCLIENEAGNYPDLPVLSRDWKDPYEDYDLPQQRRNYKDPVHPNHEIIGLEGHGSNIERLYTPGQSLLYAVLIFCGFVGTFLLFQPYPFFLPMMPKQYPFNELYLERGGDPSLEKEVKHYTFEPAGNDE